MKPFNLLRSLKSLQSQLNNSNQVNFEELVFSNLMKKKILFLQMLTVALTYSFGLGEFNSNLIGREPSISIEEIQTERQDTIDDSKVIKLNINKYYKYAASGLILLA